MRCIHHSLKCFDILEYFTLWPCLGWSSFFAGLGWSFCALCNTLFPCNLYNYDASNSNDFRTMGKDRRKGISNVLQSVCFTIFILIFILTWKMLIFSKVMNISIHSDINNFRWNSSLIWPFGAIVRHGKGDLYKAEGDVNCAEPGNSSQSRFYRYIYI